jgi:hypothetical protein
MLSPQNNTNTTIMKLVQRDRAEDFNPCGAAILFEEQVNQVEIGFCQAYCALCCDFETDEDCAGLKQV